MRRVIDIETAAVVLGCTGRHVRRMVADGRLVNHGTARRILVDLDEVYDLPTRRVATP